MNLAEAWRTLPFGAADRHAEALTLAATRALRAGRPADAFEFIDRRCRVAAPPRAVDLAIRALAAHLCGRPHEARRDLDRAAAADPLDPMVAMTRLRLATDPAEVQRVAASVAAGGHAAPSLLGAVLARLAETGAVPCLVGLDILDGRLSGFAAWPSGRSVELELAGPDGSVVLSLTRDPSLSLASGVDACRVAARAAIVPDRYRLRGADGAILAAGGLWPRASRLPLPATPSRVPDDVPPRAPLTIVVPVYRGREATRDCFEALLEEAGLHENLRIVAVDDASPDPEIAAFLDGLAGAGLVELRRNASNLGFAGAVRRGLEGEDDRDILFLNADAVLPPGALDRLAAAVYAAPDIGTATPFSNAGEYASLPRHAEASPPPPPGETLRIDAAAAAANVGGVVDLPTGTGFCLFVRHDCMAAVGSMPAIYGRGYFEDMEFCLRARRAGFRNVCATSLYVVHHGSASFGDEKRALAVRNLALVRRRFPGIEAECAAYAQADPLRDARRAVMAQAGLEARAPEGAAADPVAAPEEAPAGRPPALGVLAPVPFPEGDAFVRRLSAALRARLPDARIVVLGTACDDLALMGRGNVFVTGPIAEGECRSLAARFGVAALAPPLAGSPAAFLDAAIGLDLPVLHPALPAPAEPGAFPADGRDHAHDPAHALVAQFARRLEA